jgi:hypothetical protein
MASSCLLAIRTVQAAAGHAVTAPFHDNRQDGQDWQDAGME